MDRFTTDALIFGLALPAGVGMGAAVVAGLLSRCRFGFVSAAFLALAPAGAFLLSMTLFGWLEYPPKATQDWIVWLGLAAGVAEWLASPLDDVEGGAGPRIAAFFRCSIALAVGVAAAWFLLPDFSWAQWLRERPFWLLLVPPLIFALWMSMMLVFKSGGALGAGAALTLAAWGGAVAALCVVASNARFGQEAGVITATVGGAGVVALLWRRVPYLHLAPAALAMLGGLALQSYIHSRTDWNEAPSPHDVPLVCFLLVLGAPLSAWLFEAPGIRRLPPWARRLGQALVVLAIAGLGVALGLLLPEAMPGDEWE